MVIVFFIAAIAVSALLEWQERKQRKEMVREFEQLDIPQPERRPKVQLLESWLTVYIGTFMIVFGGLTMLAVLQTLQVLTALANLAGTDPQISSSLYEILILLIGGGAALIVLGVRAVRENKRYSHS